MEQSSQRSRTVVDRLRDIQVRPRVFVPTKDLAGKVIVSPRTKAKYQVQPDGSIRRVRQ